MIKFYAEAGPQPRVAATVPSGRPGTKKGSMRTVTPQVNVRKASTLLKAMANERRLLILHHLTQGEKTVRELEGLIGLSQSALSQHLARLRRQHLVRTRRNAQSIFYSLDGQDATIILEALDNLYADCARMSGALQLTSGNAPHPRPDTLGHRDLRTLPVADEGS